MLRPRREVSLIGFPLSDYGVGCRLFSLAYVNHPKARVCGEDYQHGYLADVPVNGMPRRLEDKEVQLREMRIG